MNLMYSFLIIQTLLVVRTQAKVRIIGGEIAPKGEYEWFYDGGDGCGASLVAPDMLLTAAHCSEAFSDPRFDARYIHPDYKDNQSERKGVSHDFMIVKLRNPLNRTPVKMDDGTISSTYDDNKELWTLGYGDIKEDDEITEVPEELHHVTVNYISPCSCERRLRGLLDSSMMCAADFVNDEDACQGDSGGPLYDKENDVLVGIVSWGYGCANDFFPGVYSRVADQLPWIKAMICEHSDFAEDNCEDEFGHDQWSCTNYDDWQDALNSRITCSSFENNLCEQVGHLYIDRLSRDANEACCICGGGTILKNDGVDRSTFTCDPQGGTSSGEVSYRFSRRVGLVILVLNVFSLSW